MGPDAGQAQDADQKSPSLLTLVLGNLGNPSQHLRIGAFIRYGNLAIELN